MTTAIVSDLHLGSRMSVLGAPPASERLLQELGRADQVVLLGDLLSLREGAVTGVLEAARPFLERLGEVAAGRRIVIVPGNHDHRLAEPLLDQRGLRDGAGPLGLEHLAEPDGALLHWLAQRLGRAEVVVAYPGLWVRPDVYATHGHYVDCHMTVPRPERLVAAAMQRAMGGLPRGRLGPEDYEAVLAPLYAFAFRHAQGADGELVWAKALDRVKGHAWRALGRSPGRPAAAALTLLAASGGLAAVNRAGLGPFRAQFSPAAVLRAATRAMGEVVGRLGIAADHVIFGHTHGAGPLPGAGDDWKVPGGPGLVNAGSWIYETSMMQTPSAEDPYWPGRCVLVAERGPPELRTVLAEWAA